MEVVNVHTFMHTIIILNTIKCLNSEQFDRLSIFVMAIVSAITSFTNVNCYCI